jgi:hypothetical protein
MIDRAKEFFDSGGTSGGYVGLAALCYWATRDTKYLLPALGPTYETTQQMYSCPGDPYDGLPSLPFNAHGNFLRFVVPVYMQALVDAGIPFAPPRADTCTAPQRGASFVDRLSQPANLEILLLDPDDRAFSAAFEVYSSHGANLRIIDPEGKVLAAEAKTPHGNYRGDNALRLQVPKDSKTGLYQLSVNGYWFPFKMPVSELPGEAAVLRPRAAYGLKGLGMYLAPPRGHSRPVHFTIRSVPENFYDPATKVQISDAQGAVVIDSSVAAAGERSSVLVTIDPGQHPPPWRLALPGTSQVEFSGCERVYLGPDPKKLVTVVDAAGTPGK